MASFFVPLTAMAAEREDTEKVLELTADTCLGGACVNHEVKGSDKIDRIHVASGHHTITLDNVNLDTLSKVGICAFSLGSDATVDLTLKGKNSVKSGDNCAGIFVPAGATLNIINEKGGSGSLEATGGARGAGIGGQTTWGAGNINIVSGTVNAFGGEYAAGIGGGSQSSGGTVEITGGTVTAVGGLGRGTQLGGPGIGYGSQASSKNGSVVITGGKVTAIGGENETLGESLRGKGIACSNLSSKGHSVNNLMISGEGISLDPGAGSLNDFHGIVQGWASNENSDYTKGTGKYTVYGNAVIGEFESNANPGELYIPAGNSLTLNQWKSSFKGTITGSGTLHNAHILVNYAGGAVKLDSSVDARRELCEAAIVEKSTIEYNGKDLTNEAITIKPHIDEIKINTEGWSVQYQRNGEMVDQIKDAGNYRVTWSKEGQAPFSKTITVTPKPITEEMIPEIKNQTYTGTEIEPLEIVDENILDVDGNPYVLVDGKDYSASYANNTKVSKDNETKVTVSALPNANYTLDGSVVKEFKIVQADFLESATVSAKLKDPEYNGELKGEPKVEVTLKGSTTPLKENTDYKVVSYTPEKLLDAGTYTVTVKALDTENCRGEATGTFEIVPKPLKASAAVAVDREYDGSTEVGIKEVTLNGVIEEDKAFVNVDLSKVKGDVKEPGDASKYQEVTLKNLALVGSEASNYTIEETQSNVALNPAVEIAKAKPPAPILEGVCKASDEIKDKFTYTLSIKNEAKGVKYVYWMDTGKEQESPVFDGLDPGSKHTFYAKAVESNNVEASNKGTTGEVTIDKLTQKAPGSFTLTFTENGDGTFTATIPTGENTEYSFDGINWSQANTKTDCLPNTTYTGYLRYAEIGDYGASPAVTSTQTTPKVAVAQPVISPEGGAFINEQTVSITTTTADAVIYYTTDGTVPTAKSKKYTEPFKIDETMTIKAIAVKGGMENSSVASADFELATGDMLQTKLTTKKGVVVSAELKKTKYSTKDKITAKLSRVLTANSGYNYLNIAYYDISIQMSVDGKKWKKATAENFPAEGLTITMSYPQGTAMDTHDFVAAHMYGETSERLGIKAGEIEEPIVTKTQEGLEFTVTGTSPVGIAWKAAAAGSANNNAGNNGNDSSNGNNNNSGNDGNSARDANAAGGNNSTNNNDGIGGGNGANGDGTTVNGENANGESAASESSEEKGLSSLLPQTGDMSSILPWVALAAISALILIILGVRKRRR